MSYCRWSSDDYQCDVYVYRSDYGYECHVSGRRRDFGKAGITLPPPADCTKDSLSAWLERQSLVSDLLDDPRFDDDDFEGWVNVPEPHAGQSYTVRTAGECADLLEEIRATGCNVPQYAIDALREEAVGEGQ